MARAPAFVITLTGLAAGNACRSLENAKVYLHIELFCIRTTACSRYFASHEAIEICLLKKLNIASRVLSNAVRPMLVRIITGHQHAGTVFLNDVPEILRLIRAAAILLSPSDNIPRFAHDLYRPAPICSEI
jgi:hypothetical protein